MPNTITNTTIVKGRDLVVNQILLVSDGSEETDYVAYDSSAVATLLGKADTLACKILKVQLVISNPATATAFTLEYDATTDVIALPIVLGASGTTNFLEMDFREQGGIVNLANGTTGATGDIVLTTSALDSGDTILMNLFVQPF